MTLSGPTRRFFVTAMAGSAMAALAGCIPNMPVMRMSDAADDLEFGLWAGVPGARFGDRIDRSVGIRRIRGPRNWTHPITGKRLTVYVRTKQEPSGTKTSFYTLRPDGTALARVYDSRPGRADRYFTNDAFVPIGPWRSGMSKSYRMAQHSKGKASRYTVTIHLTRASFTHKGIPGSMEYVWTERSSSGRKSKELLYIYSPGKGLVETRNLMN